jgi:ERCC4-related helicase
MLKNFKPRLYQETIFNTVSKYNTLVVLPTGMGKTGIALMAAAHRLKLYPNKKIMILAPTKPLVEQIMQVFKTNFDSNFLNEDEIVMFTGHVKSEKREEMFKKAKIIASTPQGMQNDIISGKIDLKEVSLLVFDEAHRASGDYAYNFISEQYSKKAQYEKILALTASPGSEMEKIEEVVQNLNIEKIEVRSDEDPDVKPYVQEMNIKWVKVDLGDEFASLRKYIYDCYKDKLSELKQSGFLNSGYDVGKGELLKIQGSIQAQLSQGTKDFDTLKALSKIAETLKIQHALELVESQGVFSTYAYLEKLNELSKTSKVKALQNLVRDINFRSALIKSKSLLDQGIEHPKMDKLKEIIENENKNSDAKIIIFTQYRDTGIKIVEMLNSENDSLNNVRLFLGQQKKNGHGLSQKDQINMLNDFRKGEFNIMVSTAVGEEGLDIPQVDLVIFYEPVPSAIRTIQRRGRTGRTEKGRMIVMIANGTRDEIYRWSAHHKEKRMHRNLDSLKNNTRIFSLNKENLEKNINSNGNKTLTEMFEQNFGKNNFENNPNDERNIIFVDDREKGSSIVKELVNLNIDLRINRLNVGDYVLSQRVGIEFKTIPDFVDSIIDGRLISQVKELKEYFFRPLIIVQGTEDIYSLRKIHPNAINGMLAAITINFGVPILFTRNPKETAMLLSVIASREQDEIGRNFTSHRDKKLSSVKEIQEYIVSSFPGIGPIISRPLLEQFGSIKNIVNASEIELKNIESIGEIKAKKLKEIFETNYNV